MAKEMVGKIGILAPNHFDNGSNLKSISSPVFLIHGTHDDVIPAKHSEELYEIATTKHKRLKLCKGSDHNSLNYNDDIFLPTKEFLEDYTILPKTEYLNKSNFITATLPPKLFKCPEEKRRNNGVIL